MVSRLPLRHFLALAVPALPAVMRNGFAQHADMLGIDAAGFRLFGVEPFAPALLRQVVRDLVGDDEACRPQADAAQGEIVMLQDENQVVHCATRCRAVMRFPSAAWQTKAS